MAFLLPKASRAKEESCGSKLILLCNFASRLLLLLCRLFGVTIGLKEVSLAMHHGVIGKKNFAQACSLVDLGNTSSDLL